jgi:glycosyltransferase involved in cell wall biosynthesis
MRGSDRIVVQQSFPEPRPDTNAYTAMLRDALAATPGIEVRTFTWRRALLGRYDVFHAHWPEILVSGHSPLKKLVRQALTIALVLRLRIARIPIVRTMHNLEIPQGITRREVVLLRWFDRRTTLRINLNPATPATEGSASVTILHGDYRAWFARHPRHDAVPGRIAYFGLIRRYKAVDDLIEVFALVDDAALSLSVGGRPSTPELAERILSLAAADPRVAVTLGQLTDAELVGLVTEAQLIVLPYREMHNSGSVLTALSLDRPVLVPDNEATAALAAEVGDEWVLRFPAPLTPEALTDAFGRATAEGRPASPDLSRRDWKASGLAHLDAYRTARRLVRGARA